MTKAKSLLPWPNLAMANMAFQGAMLAFEAQQVIGLRLAKMAQGGPEVPREAALMVSEKLEAMAESGQADDAGRTRRQGGSGRCQGDAALSPQGPRQPPAAAGE